MISTFARDILSVLANADESLSSSQISERINSEASRFVSAMEVDAYLKVGLNGLVGCSEGKWFFPMESNETARLVLVELCQSSAPLDVTSLSLRCSTSAGRNVGLEEIWECLANDLRDKVDRKEEGWTLSTRKKKSRVNKVSTKAHSPQDQRHSDEDDTDQQIRDVQNKNEELIALVLAVLNKVSKPLQAREIAKQIRDGGKEATKKQVNGLLYGQLQKAVVSDDDYRWRLMCDSLPEALEDFLENDNEAYPEFGKRAHGAVQGNVVVAGQGEKSEELSIGGAGRPQDDRIEIAKQLVRQVLRLAGRPLRTTEIIQLLKKAGHDLEVPDVKDAICAMWGEDVDLKTKKWQDKDFVDDTAERNCSATQSGIRSEREEVASEGPTEEINRDEPTALVSISPQGDAKSVIGQLELAQKVALLLDMSSRPLSRVKLARLLSDSGFEVDTDDVDNCLHGVLLRYVDHVGEGWRLHASGEIDETTRKETANSGELPTFTVQGIDYRVESAEKDTPAFFSSTLRGGSTIVHINNDHPAAALIEEVLFEPGDTPGEYVAKAREGICLLLSAWARYENQLRGKRKHEAEETREDWGRIARKFLE